jgi:alkanesulfonate monooxygenase SsuD/methylene tetrahydromethanopterin reductase-like flavin-dependent oxidoreductase (luciferase family)
VRFDLFRGQVLGWPDFVEDVRFIESTGAGTCWVLDHYVYPPAPEAQALEAWTTLASLAAVTEGIRLGTAVSDAALRHPAMLAKQVATVEQISGGRVEVAFGAGLQGGTGIARHLLPHPERTSGASARGGRDRGRAPP